MAKVLTADAQVVCSHPGGTVKVAASQQSLLAGGSPVLVMGDMEGKPVSGCTNPASTSTAPCTAVVSTLAGAATKLTAGSKPVLLDTATGVTNSIPPGTWRVQSPGQTKLEAS
jgi:hypothetical protein